MKLDGTFYSLLEVTGRICDIGQNILSLLLVSRRIRDIGQNVLSLLLVSGRICDIGQNALQSSFGDCANTSHWTESFTVFCSNTKQ